MTARLQAQKAALEKESLTAKELLKRSHQDRREAFLRNDEAQQQMLASHLDGSPPARRIEARRAHNPRQY